MQLDRDLAAAFLARLKASFPQDYENFLEWTGTSPAEYLVADGDFNAQTAGKLVELLVEYMPLTKQQKDNQTPEQLRHWEEVEAIQTRLAHLEGLGESARFSAEWIEVILDAGRRIQFRPSVSEAVAPYVTPHTPTHARPHGIGSPRCAPARLAASG